MKILIWIVLFVVSAALALMLWVRLAPVDAALWHVDPTRATRPGPGGWLLSDVGGDAPAARFDAAPEQIMAQLDRIARATPRTRPIAGDPGEGWITYQTRSRVFGFPDYTSVRATPTPQGGTALSILARLRFGNSDLGVNRARAENWVDRLRRAQGG